ncbi:unnamed protein product [Calypogeia fissa]
MGSPADLALGCRAESPVATTGNLFKVVPSSMEKVDRDRAQMLDEYLKALEDERRKIEAFKRELPHCMQLLDYAIDASKENLVQSPSSSPGPPLASIIGKTTKTLGLFGKEVVQEFLKSRWDTTRKDDMEEEEKEKPRRSSGSAVGDRPTWMAEAQLWTQPSLTSDHWKEKESSTEDSVRPKKDSEKSTLTSPARLFSNKQRPGGAFIPFVKEKPAPGPVIRSKPGVADFMLSSGDSRPSTILGFGAVDSEVGSVEIGSKTTDVNTAISHGKETGGRVNGVGSTYSGGTGSTTTTGGENAQRKARRCWSPELHRRFVSALQQLGGSQVATPKQIRELMKVDGLTNDEVKSHLQKYRLHTRRPSPTPQAPQQNPPQLVVLGGIWVPPEYQNAGMYHDPSSSVSQQEPVFCQPTMSQEFYSQLHPTVQIELHRSPSHSSPQGPLQSTSNPSSGAHQTSGEGYREDSAGEDGKSESSSWKGDENMRESAEKDTLGKKTGSSSSSQDEDEADDGRDGQVRLQLEMSCSSVHSVKTEPSLA